MTSREDAFADSPSSMRWIVFVGPLASFALVGFLLPRIVLGVDAEDIPISEEPELATWVTIVRVVAMLAIIGWAMPKLCRVFPIRISGLSVLVGLIGGVTWIGLCRLNLEAVIWSALGFASDSIGSRDAVNPWAMYPDSYQRTLFLIARFTLLVVAVPIAEELMLRGCLIRAIEVEDWHALPLNQVGRTGLIAATLYGVFSHPNEWIAAAVWFSLITWMMVRTNRFWDCVVAHAITNAMLGIYIVQTSDWRLW